MTDIVIPPAVIVPPTFPDLGNPNFNAMAFAWGTALPGVSVRIGEIALATKQNADATKELAIAANASAVSAADSASAAAEDADRLATLDALWLGESATDPTTGRNGAPLVAGNAYVNTSTGALRAYTGSAWVQGVHGAAGVASLNGMVGPLVLATLEAYGITDIGVGAKGATDLNTLVVPGMYTFAGAGNAPAGVTGGVVYVARDGGVLGQMIVDVNGSTFSRGATGIGGSPTFSPWRRGALHDDVVVPLAGGAINCAAGNYFTETVNGARTLAFSNEPAGAYSCVLEINYVSGVLTMFAGTVWAGPVPTLATGKRYLIFFQRAQLGTAGWYASALAGYSA